jgi:ligand-binding sensor domain-containing protein
MRRLLLYTGFFASILVASQRLRAQQSGVSQRRAVTPPHGASQRPSPTPPPGISQSPAATQLAFEHLTMAQGLPSNIINGILIDHKGYLWVATMAGLCRYNGYNFVTYKFDPHNPGSLDQNVSLSLFEDDRGDIWVGNIEGGINRFDRNTEKFIRYRPQQPPKRFEPVLRAVSAMNEDKQGYLWVGSFSGELRRFDRAAGRFSDFDYSLGYHPLPGDLRPFDEINCIYQDSHHDLWIGNKSGLHLLVPRAGRPFDPGSVSFRHFVHDPADSASLEGTEVASVLEDHTGNLWVLTGKALNRLDRSTGRFTHYRNDPRIPGSFNGGSYGNMVEDTAGYLWIPTQKGVDRLDPQRQHFDHFVPVPGDRNSISSAGKCRMAIDKAGALWIGSNGIDRLDPLQVPITTYQDDDTDKKFPWSIKLGPVCEDQAGIVWVADNNGLDALDRRTGHFTPYRHDPRVPWSISAGPVSALLRDDEGMIWVSTWAGTVDRLDPRTGRFTHYIGPDGRFKNIDRYNYHVLYLDHRGVLWIGETGSGVTELDYKKDIIIHFSHDPDNPDGLSDYQANCICEDQQGFLWIGHGSVATDRLDPRTGRFQHYRYEPSNPAGISSNCVNVIFKDRKGNLWFGTTGGGLCRYHDSTGRFSTYTEKDGLRDNNVNSILEDTAGNLWLGTVQGICRFDPRTDKFTDFNYPNSPVDNRTTFLFGRTHDDRLWFGNGNSSVSNFDPAAFRANKYVPPVVITRFNLLDSNRPGSDQLTSVDLAYDQNFFSFEFSALDFTDPPKNHYAYKLDGVDKDWVYCGTRRIASYTDIAPGNYTFRVKGSNNEGVWNNTGAFITVTIHPPWWRTWWAYTFYVLFILVMWYYLERRQHLRLVARERDRGKARELEMQALRAQMNPHFIFNSLTSINRFILKNDRLAASDYLTRFSRLIRMVLNHSKLMLIPLDDELDMLRLYLDMEKLRFKEVFSYTIDTGDDAGRENILIPPMVFQPFVENAIWHGLMHKSEPGRLEIMLRVDGDTLTCTITDNGIGRAAAAAASSKSAQKRKSMGIDITQQRLDLINGPAANGHSLKIVDLYDDQGNAAGTRVTIQFHFRTSNQS